MGSPRGALHRTVAEEPFTAPHRRSPASSLSQRSPSASHRGAPEELLITPRGSSYSPSSHRPQGALHHHCAAEEPFHRAAWFFLEPFHRAAAEQPFHRAALHHAAPEEPFSTAPPQRSSSSHRTVLLAALRCAAPEQPLRGACHRAAPEEPLIIPGPEELFIIAPHRRSPWTWLCRRSSCQCCPALLGSLSPHHPGGGLSPRRRRGALHHAAWLFSEPLVVPPRRSPSPRRPGGAPHRAAREEPFTALSRSSPSPRRIGGAHHHPFPRGALQHRTAPPRPGGAPHLATRFFLQPLIADTRRSLHCTAPEEPFYRASPEECIITLATEQPLMALRRRSP